VEQTGQKALPLNSAYPFGIEHGLEKEMDEIRNMEIEWDLSYTSTLRRGYIVQLFRDKGLFSRFTEQHWPVGRTPWGERKVQSYLRVKSRYDDFLAGKETESDDGDETVDEDQQFVAESDLRNVLAANLERIEPGLHLYRDENKSGVEYSIDDGRIDILAVDRQDKYVVIELKLSRGRNKTVGQLLYYMGWIDAKLGNPPCRGMIIAKEIQDDLVLAVQRVQGISLYRYKLQISVEPVSIKQAI